MNIIIPMMGVGQRFRDSGYITGKPMIKAHGKEILFWLLDELDVKNNNVLLICRADSEQDRMSERIRSRYYDCVDILFLKDNTEGAAHTVQIALNSGKLDLTEPVAVCDSDTFYSSSHIEKMKAAKNAIFYFKDSGETPLFSYLKVDNGKVVKIVEKQKISDFASVGTYCFESGKLALQYCEEVMRRGKKSNGEYYVSNVIQVMIEDGYGFKAIEVDDFTCLGTPSQLQGFNPKKKLRICFDIDNTIFTEPQVPGDYSSVKPIDKNIEFLRFLKNQGHTIILQTARRMKTHGGNVGKLLADIGKLTFRSLDIHNVPYDEIYFGKPHADFYIDDKAVDAYGDLEKLTGVYHHEMIARDHNLVESKEDFVQKTSNNKSIRGELYWYLHAPREVQHLVPRLIDHYENDENLTLVLEKIEGPTLSKLLTTCAIRPSHIDELITCLKKIHKTEIENNEVDLYQNYVKKLDLRFESFEEKHEWIKSLYEDIRSFLLHYEALGLAERANIHGDPVFTNIIVDKSNRLKMFDMRGMQGEELTITGDKNYDYAKVYQSLVGYDFVIKSSPINHSLLSKLEERFFACCNVDKKIIKGLTASLLFTCVPLQPKSFRNRLLSLSKYCIENATKNE